MVNEDPPTAEEMEHVLKTFENKKSAGTGKLKTEGFKYNSSNHVLRVLLLPFNLIWSLVSVPTTWLHTSITCLHIISGVR